MSAKRNTQKRMIRGIPLAMAMLLSFVLLAGSKAQAQQPQRFTLKQAVSLALQNSRDLSLARLRFNVSQSEVELNRSQFRPNIVAGSGLAYTYGFPLAAGGGAPAIFTLNYQQVLFDPLARSDVRVAEQAAEQHSLAVDAARDAVIVRVASAYLELAKVRRELDLLRRERESGQKILDFTRQRMEAGFELPIEVTRAQLTSARIEQRIAHLEGQDDLLADQLRGQLSLPPDQPIEVAAEDLPASADAAVSDLVAQALRNNIELKQAESEREGSAEHLKGERNGRWPTVSLTGQYNVLAKFNNYDQFFSKFQPNNVLAGIEVRIPIFTSRVSPAVSLAQANFQAAALAVENKRVALSADVRQKAQQARELQMGREVARLELDVAQQNLQVLQLQFQQGRASLRDLEAAQLDENDKWLAFLDADFARQQAQLELLRTTGQVAQLAQ
jgi:outer membrane protein TolC